MPGFHLTRLAQHQARSAKGGGGYSHRLFRRGGLFVFLGDGRREGILLRDCRSSLERAWCM